MIGVKKPCAPSTGERVSDRSVSLDAGLSADYLRSLRRQYERGTQVGVTTPAITAIARALKTTPEWLLHGLGSEQPGASSDRVEIRLSWNIIPDGDHFLVEEEFGNASGEALGTGADLRERSRPDLGAAAPAQPTARRA